MEIHLSRRRTLSEKQRRKKILDPTNSNEAFHGNIFNPVESNIDGQLLKFQGVGRFKENYG